MGLKDKAEWLKDVTSRTSSDADEGEQLSDEVEQEPKSVDAERDEHGDTRELGPKALGEAAIEAAGLRNRKGKISKLRVAKAAITPASTAGKVAKGVGAEVVRQSREIKNQGLAGRSEERKPTEPPLLDDDPTESA